MKPLSESKALLILDTIRTSFRHQITDGFEHRAKSCSACETPGACCIDEHFVNVRIARLEAVAIGKALERLPAERRENVYSRISKTVEKYCLDDDLSSQTYACPLFEKGTGCLVHETAKPLPCIAHACYERNEDLPPDELLAEREAQIDELNRRVYGKTTFLPIPIAVEVVKNCGNPLSCNILQRSFQPPTHYR
jgi:hypothetical protein